MIGLGFNFAERYLLETHGDEALEVALRESCFATAEPWLDSLDYPDADFDRWIESCAAVDQCSSEALLRRLGRWAMPRLLRRYALLGLDGGSPKALLRELAERLLPQFQRSMLLAQGPGIEIDCGDTRAELAYRSRGELCALFEGALQGLGEQFDMHWRIEHLQCEGRGDDGCRFRITLPEVLAA